MKSEKELFKRNRKVFYASLLVAGALVWLAEALRIPVCYPVVMAVLITVAQHVCLVLSTCFTSASGMFLKSVAAVVGAMLLMMLFGSGWPVLLVILAGIFLYARWADGGSWGYATATSAAAVIIFGLFYGIFRLVEWLISLF